MTASDGPDLCFVVDLGSKGARIEALWFLGHRRRAQTCRRRGPPPPPTTVLFEVRRRLVATPACTAVAHKFGNLAMLQMFVKCQVYTVENRLMPRIRTYIVQMHGVSISVYMVASGVVCSVVVDSTHTLICGVSEP